MALLFQSPHTEKWRLHELDAILDSIEDEIEVVPQIYLSNLSY